MGLEEEKYALEDKLRKEGEQKAKEMRLLEEKFKILTGKSLQELEQEVILYFKLNLTFTSLKCFRNQLLIMPT